MMAIHLSEGIPVITVMLNNLHFTFNVYLSMIFIANSCVTTMFKKKKMRYMIRFYIMHASERHAIVFKLELQILLHPSLSSITSTEERLALSVCEPLPNKRNIFWKKFTSQGKPKNAVPVCYVIVDQRKFVLQ